MNEQQLVKKVRQDAEKVKQDLSKLAKDSAARISKLQTGASQVTGQAKIDLTQWVEDTSAQLSEMFEKQTGSAKQAVVGAVASARKDVGHGLDQYSAKAKQAIDKIPVTVTFVKKRTMFPWIPVSIILAVGFVVGISGFLLFKPAPKPIG
jgi:ElaB/YqjD/DUF883 family membrane-anchored ribosome-binding protein